MRAPNLPVLFHPDCDRRLRDLTESADPADCSTGARGLWRSLAITAGGDFHPAPRTRPDCNPADTIAVEKIIERALIDNAEIPNAGFGKY
jgi:hypothetical protein